MRSNVFPEGGIGSKSKSYNVAYDFRHMHWDEWHILPSGHRSSLNMLRLSRVKRCLRYWDGTMGCLVMGLGVSLDYSLPVTHKYGRNLLIQQNSTP